MSVPLSPFFNLPTEINGLPQDIQETIIEVQEKAGFVPNVFLMLAVVVTTSAQNHCIYCVVAHGALLRIYSKDPLIADQVAVNHRTAPLSERHRVMLDFALYVSLEAGELNEAWVEELEAVGFTREDIWDIGAVCAFFGLSNRMVSLTGTPPNQEFYLLGRQPKSN